MVQAPFHWAPTFLIPCVPLHSLELGESYPFVPRCLWRSIFFSKLPKLGLEHNCFSLSLVAAPLSPCVALSLGLYKRVLCNCSPSHFTGRALLNTLTVLIAPGGVSSSHLSPFRSLQSPSRSSQLCSFQTVTLPCFSSLLSPMRHLAISCFHPIWALPFCLPVGASTWFVIMPSSFLFAAPFWAHPRSHGSWGQEGLRLLSAGASALDVPSVIHCGLLKPRWSIPVLFAASCPPACHM